MIKTESMKYETRQEFARNSKGAYRAAQQRGILNQVCTHMPVRVNMSKKTYNFKWTEKELLKISLQYRTRQDFREGNMNAYAASVRFGVLDQICAHMNKSSGVSKPEQNLFSIIKGIYPKTQKFRDMKVNIPDKPYIKGFDLDIYIPELRKGIEFDGTYWHSVKGLKRSRTNWPENDLTEYHQIKDQHFKAKGVEVLHIKEADWETDNENCIQKCLDFLK